MNKNLRDQGYFPPEEYYKKEIPIRLLAQGNTNFAFTPDVPVAIDFIEWTNHANVRLVSLILGNIICYEEGVFSFTRKLIDPGYVVQGSLFNSSDSDIDSVIVIHGRTIIDPLNELLESSIR